MKAVKASLALAAILGLGLAGCASSGADAGTGSDGAELVKVRVGDWNGAYTAWPVYVAKSEGFFEKHGIEPELVALKSETMVPALLSGSLDVMPHTGDAVMTLAGKGTPVEMIVGLLANQQFGVAGVAKAIDNCDVAEAAYPKQVACLEGMRIGIPSKGGSAEKTLQMILEDGGLTLGDVQLVVVGASSNAIAAFKADQIDYMFGTEPALTEVQNTIGDILVSASSVLNPPEGTYPGSVIFGVQSHLDENPELFKSFIKAIQEAQDFMADPANADAVAQAYSDVTGHPLDSAKDMWSNVEGTFGGELNCDGINWGVKVWTDKGVLPADSGMSCDTLVWSGAK